MTNVGRKIGNGDEILLGFLQALHGNVGISVVDKAPPQSPRRLGPTAVRGSPPQNIKICCGYFWIGFRSSG